MWLKILRKFRLSSRNSEETMTKWSFLILMFDGFQFSRNFPFKFPDFFNFFQKFLDQLFQVWLNSLTFSGFPEKDNLDE